MKLNIPKMDRDLFSPTWSVYPTSLNIGKQVGDVWRVGKRTPQLPPTIPPITVTVVTVIYMEQMSGESG